MKKPLLLLSLLVMLLSGSLSAQTNVYLKINHKMGDSTFALNKNTETPEGDPFKFSRLDYYLSGIVLIHDGGQKTEIADTWLLVKGTIPINTLLGTHAIINLEEIRFAIGVEQEFNHLDPSIYSPSHPLAPKSPSMHWGWEAGYRFIALEGSGGAARDKDVQIHSLGDFNYMQIKINTAGIKTGNDLTIELNADYAQALNGIETLSGVLIHSDDLEARDMSLNFVTHVFTSSEGNNSALSASKITPSQAVLFPNPTRGCSTLSFKEGMTPSSIRVYDQQGKCVDRYEQITEVLVLKPQSAGFYMIALEYDGIETRSIKWIITP